MHVISNIMITSCMSFWQPSSTLSDVWDLLFEEPYPTLSVVIQSWMRGLRSSSLPLRCPFWQFQLQGGQHSSGAEGSNSHRNTNTCACMPSATSWLCHVCPSGSNPPHCLTFGIWRTLSYSERCHSELDVRPEVIIRSSSLSGLVISPSRRATLEWCGGLQFSPQHKYMCMHAISNIMIMSCMSFWQQSSTLSDVWDLRNLILLWALSFRVGCAAWGHHPFLFVVWFGNCTKAGNLPVVRRRLQFSPQHNDMRKHAQHFWCDHCRLTCQGIVLASHGSEMCF